VDNAYESYLESLRAGLARSACRSQAEAVFAEAKQHLDEGIEELVRRGMSQEAAERAAIDRFGEADAVCNWYAEVHQPTKLWHAARPSLTVLALLFLFAVALPKLGLQFGVVGFGNLILLNCFFVAMAVAAFRAKRWVIAPVIVGAAASCLLMFIVEMACFVPLPGRDNIYGAIPRWAVAKHLRFAQEEVRKSERLLAIFAEGQKMFARDAPPPGGAGIFQDPSGGYRAPFYFEMQSSPVLTVYLGSEKSDGVFKTWKEAAHFWRPQAPSKFATTARQRDPYPYSVSLRSDHDLYIRTVTELPRLAARPNLQQAGLFLTNLKYTAILLLVFAILPSAVGGVLRFLRPSFRRGSGPFRLAGG
jgi:hypothetical protein